MSRVSAFKRNTHISIFRFLINFDAQFPVNVKIYPFEYKYVHKCNLVSETPFIYKKISCRLLNSSTHLEICFLLLLMTPNPSSMNLLNISGHVIFFRMHIVCSSSSSIAIYMFASIGARLVPITIPLYKKLLLKFHNCPF
jgi:hypothetical protein